MRSFTETDCLTSALYQEPIWSIKIQFAADKKLENNAWLIQQFPWDFKVYAECINLYLIRYESFTRCELKFLLFGSCITRFKICSWSSWAANTRRIRPFFASVSTMPSIKTGLRQTPTRFPNSLEKVSYTEINIPNG